MSDVKDHYQLNIMYVIYYAESLQILASLDMLIGEGFKLKFQHSNMSNRKDFTTWRRAYDRK